MEQGEFLLVQISTFISIEYGDVNWVNLVQLLAEIIQERKPNINRRRWKQFCQLS